MGRWKYLANLQVTTGACQRQNPYASDDYRLRYYWLSPVESFQILSSHDVGSRRWRSVLEDGWVLLEGDAYAVGRGRSNILAFYSR